MRGLCDLHCHLLHGLDDGAKTLDETLQMARVLVALGFTSVAPSPHNRPEYAPREVAIRRLNEVQEELRSAKIALELARNAENFFLDEGFLPSLGTDEARLLGNGPYALIEAPYTAPLTPLLEIIFRMKLKGVIPLIAHPERCYEFERKGRAAEAVQAGACLQLDVGALVGRYGPKARKVALALLEDKLYSVAATDLHSPRGAAQWLGKGLEELHRRVGQRTFEVLLKDNPRRMLAGQTLV